MERRTGGNNSDVVFFGFSEDFASSCLEGFVIFIDDL